MKRLVKVQNELKAPKGQFNKFGNYKYRSAEDILTAVKPLLADNDLAMTITDDIVAVNDRVYVKALVTIRDVESGNVIANNCAFARESESKKGMDSSQITGTASSYARKYALNGMFLIDDTKDADTDEYHKQTKERVLDLVSLKAMFDTALTVKEKEDTLKHYGVSEVKELTDEQKIELSNALVKKAQKKSKE